jgi:hypothetical protein
MQLGQREATFIEHFKDGIPIMIDKNTNRKNEWGKLRNNSFGDGWLDTTRALSIKHEAQRIGSCCNCGLGILGIRYPTYFNFDGHRCSLF